MSDWVVLSVPDTDQAPAVARQFVREHAHHLRSDLVADAQLLVSELVTNAVQHGRPEITVRLRTEPPGLGVAVEDHGPQMPRLPQQAPADDSDSGRGLLILDAVSDAWGVDAAGTPPGKTVWFELAAGEG